MCNHLGAHKSWIQSGSGRPGTKPHIFVGSKDEILKQLVLDIRASGTPLGRIAVIGPVRKPRMQLAYPRDGPSGSFTSVGLNEVCISLAEAGIPYQATFAMDASDASSRPPRKPHTEGEPGQQCSGAQQVQGGDPDALLQPPPAPPQASPAAAVPPEGRVHVCSIHGSKGLEFDSVYLLDFHASTMNRAPQTQSEYVGLQCLWYVAASRARTALTLLCCQDSQPWYQLRDVPPDLLTSNAPGVHASAPPAPADLAKAPKKLVHVSPGDLLGNRQLVPEGALMGLLRALDEGTQVRGGVVYACTRQLACQSPASPSTHIHARTHT